MCSMGSDGSWPPGRRGALRRLADVLPLVRPRRPRRHVGADASGAPPHATLHAPTRLGPLRPRIHPVPGAPSSYGRGKNSVSAVARRPSRSLTRSAAAAAAGHEAQRLVTDGQGLPLAAARALRPRAIGSPTLSSARSAISSSSTDRHAGRKAGCLLPRAGGLLPRDGHARHDPPHPPPSTSKHSLAEPAGPPHRAGDPDGVRVLGCAPAPRYSRTSTARTPHTGRAT
jgi:hypothetical protein